MAANQPDKPKKIGKISISFEGFKDEVSIRNEIKASFSPELGQVLTANLRGPTGTSSTQPFTTHSCTCENALRVITHCQCDDPTCD